MIPIIMLCGGAGSGKDTVARFIQESLPNVQTVAQADPMKRLCMQVFGWDYDRLWGPSAKRNERDSRLRQDNLRSFPDGFSPYVWTKTLSLTDNQRSDLCVLLHRWLDKCAKFAGDEGLTARYALQILGTEIGRTIDPDVWVRTAHRTALALLAGESSYTCTGGLVPSTTDTKPTDLVVITDGRFRNEIMETVKIGGQAWLIRRDSGAPKPVGQEGHKSETELQGIPNWFYNHIFYNNGTLDDLRDMVESALDGVMWVPEWTSVPCDVNEDRADK